jgi:hypothetical protein
MTERKYLYSLLRNAEKVEQKHINIISNQLFEKYNEMPIVEMDIRDVSMELKMLCRVILNKYEVK